MITNRTQFNQTFVKDDGKPVKQQFDMYGTFKNMDSFTDGDVHHRENFFLAATWFN